MLMNLLNEGISSGNDSLTDSLVPSATGNWRRRKRDDKASTVGWGQGEFAGRQPSERRFSIVNSTSDHANSAGLFPGEPIPWSKAATDRNAARVNPAAGTVYRAAARKKRISTTGETLLGPAEATPAGREAYKGETESAVTTSGRESEVGRNTCEPRENRGRKGPLLPSIVQSWERQPECPREGRLHPGPIEPSASAREI